MAQTSERELANIRDDVSRLRSDLSAALSRLSTFDETGPSRFREVFGGLRDRGSAAGKRAMHATENQIRERPFLAVAIVFLMGLLLGKLVDQRLHR